MPALDPGGDIGRVAGLTLRSFLLQPLMRTVTVIVPDVLGQYAAEVPLPADQHVVQALTPKRPHEPPGK